MATTIKKFGGVANSNGVELHVNPLISDASLVSYYQFEGNSNDHQGANNGSDTSVSYGTSYGKFNQGADYNGSTGYTSLGTMGNLGSTLDTGTFTFGMWIKTNYTAAYKQFGVINDGSNTICVFNFNRNEADAYVAGYTTFAVRGEGATKYNIARTRAPIYDNVWHQIIITATPSTHAYQWYVDGYAVGTALKGTDDVTSTANFNHNFCLGACDVRGTVGSFMDCSLDDFFYMTRALTAAEIYSLYRATKKIAGKYAMTPIGSGGSMTYSNPSYMYHEFRTDGATFTPATEVRCGYLCVAGGGGGGYDAGGGGGAGGVLTNCPQDEPNWDLNLTINSAQTITIGSGGPAGGSGSTRGTAGNTSSIGALVSTTGGAGGGSAHNTGGNGGSGGGGGHSSAAGGTGDAAQGHNGAGGDATQGGGGGGWGGAGTSGAGGSAGGVGDWSYIGLLAASSITYCGGGGGGGDGATLGGDADGVSGGGNGGDVTAVGQNATGNQGGGGGGGGGSGYSTAGNGGSGFVAIIYRNTTIKKMGGKLNY